MNVYSSGSSEIRPGINDKGYNKKELHICIFI